MRYVKMKINLRSIVQLLIILTTLFLPYFYHHWVFVYPLWLFGDVFFLFFISLICC